MDKIFSKHSHQDSVNDGRQTDTQSGATIEIAAEDLQQLADSLKTALDAMHFSDYHSMVRLKEVAWDAVNVLESALKGLNN